MTEGARMIDDKDFKIGDYIVLKDSSIPLFIFKFNGEYTSPPNIVGQIGRELISSRKGRKVPYPSRFAKDYRHPTKKELMLEGLILQSIDFITEE